jgi:hypothetical protein
MRHQELKDNIDGSILKKDYLEAFLMQSAYLEAVLKYVADYYFYISLMPRKEKSGENVKFYKEMRDNFRNKGLYELVNFLNEAGVFNKTLTKDINSYREKRNKILHDLIRQFLKSDTFEQELEKTCVLGNKILKDKSFEKMVIIIEQIDKDLKEKIDESAN